MCSWAYFQDLHWLRPKLLVWPTGIWLSFKHATVPTNAMRVYSFQYDVLCFLKTTFTTAQGCHECHLFLAILHALTQGEAHLGTGGTFCKVSGKCQSTTSNPSNSTNWWSTWVGLWVSEMLMAFFTIQDLDSGQHIHIRSCSPSYKVYNLVTNHHFVKHEIHQQYVQHKPFCWYM